MHCNSSIIDELNMKIEALTMNNEALTMNNEALTTKIEEFNTKNEELNAKNEEQARELKRKDELIKLLKSEKFGSKSEKTPPVEGQPPLPGIFDEPEVVSRLADLADSTGIVEIKAYSRKTAGRKPLSADLPRETILHDIPEEQKVCPCGAALTRMGEEVSEKLRYIPAKCIVERHVRPKYACRKCEGTEDNGPTVKIAPMPPQLFPQSIATPSLVAHVVVAKFADALPLYRQEQQFSRMGVEVSRTTQATWMIKTDQRMAPLRELMVREIRSGPMVNIDETPVQVLNEPGRANTTKSYMWVFRGGSIQRPSVIFHYAPTRAGSVPTDFLGPDYMGIIQTDGYQGYDQLGQRPGIIHAGCLVHARRKFVEVEKASGPNAKAGLAHQVIELIRLVYAVESMADARGLDVDQRMALRQEKTKPVMAGIKELLDIGVVTSPPKGLLGKAIGYALGQWPKLLVFLDHGIVRPDNNWIENDIRPFAVGRKNWMFSGCPAGAAASASLYSFIVTARANGLEPFAWLNYVLARLPLASTEAEFKALLPQHIDRSLLA